MTNVKQRVWRTISKSDNSGIFMWEVMEVQDDWKSVPEPSHVYTHTSLYVPCRDGSFVIINCFHYWTEKNMPVADEWFEEYCELIAI